MNSLLFFCIIFIIIILSQRIFKNHFRGLFLPPTAYSLNWFQTDDRFLNKSSPYCVKVFKSIANNYMIVILPQNIHFFIESKNMIIYHPRQQISEILYTCPESYEFAYVVPIDQRKVPTVLCHRNLNYLKDFVYRNKVYEKSFLEFQNPLDVLYSFFTSIQKIDGINKCLLRYE